MRLLVVCAVLAAAFPLWAQPPAHPGVVRLKLATFGYAEWKSDGSGFVIADDDRLLSFDADGRPRGARSIRALTKRADVQQKALFARRGLSPDGNYWATLAAPSDGREADVPYLLDFAAEAAMPLWPDGAWPTTLDWTADGFLVGAMPPGPLFVIDPKNATHARLCRGVPGNVVHVHPDGHRIGIAGDKLYITDVACNQPVYLTPYDGIAALRPSVVVDFAFSPSGERAALVINHASESRKLWVLSLDGRQRAELAATPQYGPLAWLDEETLVYEVENGPPGSSQHTLERHAWRTGKVTPLVPPKPTCSDTLASAPPRGGRLIFQRLCDDENDSFMGLVRAK
jgi:hypothetical protein